MDHSITPEYVIVGKIGSTYGIKGWLKVIPFTEKASDILHYSPWYIETEHDWKETHVQNGKEHGKGIIAKLVGLNTPEEARLLCNKKIAILRSQLPHLPQNEYYWNDLEGLTVINQHNEVLGKIIYLMATGTNDVLVVKGTKEHAIPYLPGNVIKNINLAEKTMRVDWDIL